MEEPKIAREGLMRIATGMEHEGKDRKDQTSIESLGEAVELVSKGWLEGPSE